MVVAKRQRKEKARKDGTKENLQMEWEPQVKQTALLASPAYIGQAQGKETKHIKRGAKTEPASFLGQPTLMPQGCTIFCLPNKTEL